MDSLTEYFAYAVKISKAVADMAVAGKLLSW